jgi:hypothetical protein
VYQFPRRRGLSCGEKPAEFAEFTLFQEVEVTVLGLGCAVGVLYEFEELA